MFPPTHPCIAKRKKLKDLAFEKKQFKLCKSFEKSALSLYIYVHFLLANKQLTRISFPSGNRKHFYVCLFYVVLVNAFYFHKYSYIYQTHQPE